MTAAPQQLRERLTLVEQRIAAACARAGRARSEVTLIAVTKTVSTETALALHELGVEHLGESRPQELWRKAAALPASVHWHMIGHLQRNKLAATLPIARLIHSVDSVRLLEALEREAALQQRTVPVLLEVNVSGEASKQGFAPTAVTEALPVMQRLQRVQVTGLMTMAPFESAPEECRPVFAALRRLREELRPRLEAPHTLTELSMGMSNDFEIAIEEGATHIRLGTVLFEGLT